MNDTSPAKFVPKVIRQVTLPLFKLKPGSEIFVKILDKAYKAAALKGAAPKAGDPVKEPPMLINVLNLETGELGQIIPGASLLDTLNDTYPNDTYVRKGFWIKVGEQKASAGGGGKRYNTYTVSEIELPAEAADKPATVAKK